MQLTLITNSNFPYSLFSKNPYKAKTLMLKVKFKPEPTLVGINWATIKVCVSLSSW